VTEVLKDKWSLLRAALFACIPNTLVPHFLPSLGVPWFHYIPPVLFTEEKVASYYAYINTYAEKIKPVNELV
jgi:hypothetical protein